jgi:NADH-quinone oxidoreductase subunit C/D
MPDTPDILDALRARFADVTVQPTRDGIPTVWVDAGRVREVLRWLRDLDRGYAMLYDLTAIDEREREDRRGQPPADFTVVYHLLSLARNADIRLKVPLQGDAPTATSISDLWPNANWYEREAWDMFGIRFDGHPRLRRLLMPEWWQGYPLRKEHPSRATEMGLFTLDDEIRQQREELLQFNPADWGLETHGEDFDFMFLNVGPNHPSTHGVLRLVAQLDGQELVNLVPDIGFHHRGQEKIAERQTWHTYLPYTDRIDYLGGVLNNYGYCLAVEQLAGITLPDRAKVIRVMTAELFRIISHLVYLGTYVQDVGMMSPVFYLFTDRERAFDIIEACSGARMHPTYFRIGGVAMDLPEGWDVLVRDFIAHMRKQLPQYEKAILGNRIYKMRTKGIGAFTQEEAIAWGASGHMLRAAGLAWDLRKTRPYGGYDQFEFDIPTGEHGDCYDRAMVHMQEMWQSLRIMQQCLEQMPSGPYKSDHPRTTPPLRRETMHDIETLIDHFLNVTWGPVIPAGEAMGRIESSKGMFSYYLVSDGNTTAYRNRVRAPSFAHVQMLPEISRAQSISDLIAILASLDFVLGEIDR